jgi:hypothetical protein
MCLYSQDRVHIEMYRLARHGTVISFIYCDICRYYNSFRNNKTCNYDRFKECLNDKTENVVKIETTNLVKLITIPASIKNKVMNVSATKLHCTLLKIVYTLNILFEN